MQEIGILKTIGAMPLDIFKLIWTETMILCIAGGILGIAFALILARVTDILIRTVLPYAPGGGLVLIDLRLALITLGAIMCIGLLSGIYPAWRAGRIRPLEAIRGEVGK
jgi:putative ABC transport system permease protein